ncbi:general substrate transporter [Cladochytrium replicatum]|nr:general substrate transporter [Cladochytrium replicatum]
MAHEVNFYSKNFLFLYFAIFIAFLNSAINGYDNSLMSGIIIMKGFTNDFGQIAADAETGHPGNPAINGLLFSLIQMGQVTAFFFVGYVSDKWGRLRGLQLGSVVIILGTILEIITNSIVLYCIGRYLIGFGICFVVSAAPTYVVEAAHPVFRGRATAIYNCGWHVGAIPASVIIYALSRDPVARVSSLAWRLPCGLQLAWSAIVLLASFFLPESPRWLVSVGRVEDARKFLIKYHADDDSTNPIVEEQMREIEETIAAEKANSQGSFKALFDSRVNRYRSFIVIGVGIFSQTAGNWIAGYFQSQILPYFGIVEESQRLLFNIISSIISLISSLTGAALVDRVGRRPYLVYGSISYVLFFLLLTVLLAVYNNNLVDAKESERNSPAYGIAAFVVLQLFAISYSVCWTSINALYPVEVLAYSTRAKGMAMCQAFVNIANIVQSWGLSYGLDAYKWKFFSFYVIFNAFATAIIWKFYPETKGRTLEELDEIFASENPVKKSLEARIGGINLATGARLEVSEKLKA